MPLQKCTEGGKSGWRWGKSGKCYIGPEGKKKAIRQGISIEGPEKFQRMASAGDVEISESDIPLISYALADEGHSLKAIVAVIATLRSGFSKRKIPQIPSMPRPGDPNYPTQYLAQSDKDAGYPPNCNPGYKAKDGKCVPIEVGE